MQQNLTKSLIRDRFALFVKHSQTSHDYVDAKGRVFATFPLQELSRYLHISQRKVQTCINHLKGLNLILIDKARNKLRFYVYEPITLPITDQSKSSSEKMIVVDDFVETDIIDISAGD